VERKHFNYGFLAVVLDRDKVVPDDPGADTPAMVYYDGGVYSATYWCAVDTGELDGARETKKLTHNQIEWLDSLEQEIEEFLYS
jgi:hypothetical protein